MSRPQSRAEAALLELCANYGYCGASQKAVEFLATTADDADAWVDAVLAAEQIEPPLPDNEARRQVREVICDWLLTKDEDGARGPVCRVFPPVPEVSGSGDIPEHWGALRSYRSTKTRRVRAPKV